MAELFGAPVGFRAALQDAQTIAQTQRLRQAAAADQVEAQAKLKAMQLAEQKMKLLQGVGAPVEGGAAPPDIPSQMDAQARRLLAAGFVKEGSDLAAKSQTIRLNTAREDLSGARREDVMLGTKQKKLESLSAIFGSVQDESSFNNAKMLWMNTHPDEPLPPQLAIYNPETVSRLQQATNIGLQQIRLTRDEANMVQRDQFEAGRNARAEAAQKALSERAAMVQDRIDARAKERGAKGKAVGAPNGTMISAAEALINQEFPGLPRDIIAGPNLAASTAAYSVASEAKALQAANPGLSADEAINQAYLAAKQAGDFKLEESAIPFFGKPKASFSRSGKSPTAALPLPPDRKLVAGKYYQTPVGIVLWDGKKAIKQAGVPASPVAVPSSRAVVPVIAGDEEDDEGDE